MRHKQNTWYRDRYFLFTLALVLFHTIANLIWIWLNKVPPEFDAAFHSVLSIRFFDYLQHNLGSFDLTQFLQISKYYPPFTHWIAMVFVFLGSYNTTVIQITGTVFFIALLLATFWYTREITQNGRIAFLATFFLSFFLTVSQESRLLMTDIPSTALYILALLALAKSRLFTKKRYVLLFSVAAAFAILTRWTAGFFLLMPVLLTAIRVFRVIPHKLPHVIAYAIGGIMIIIAICLPWYSANFQTITQIASVSSTAEADDPQQLLSLENVLYYPRVFTQFQFHFFGSLFLLGAVSVFVWKQIRTRYEGKTVGKLAHHGQVAHSHAAHTHVPRTSFSFNDLLDHPLTIPVCSIIAAYLVFTFGLYNKNIRYLMPVMPFFALIMGVAADKALHMRHKQWAIWSVTFILFFYVVSYGILSFGVPIKPQFKLPVQFPLIGYLDVVYFDTFPIDTYFNNEQWPNREIARFLIDNRKPSPMVLHYVSIIEKPHLNAASVLLAQYDELKYVPDEIREWDTNFIAQLGEREVFTDEEITLYVQSNDIVIVPENSVGPKESIRDYKVREQIRDYMKQGRAANFGIVETFTTPDGDKVLIFKKLYP